MNQLDEIRKVASDAEQLFSAAEVEAAIGQVGAEVSERLGTANPIVLTVLNGGIIFAGKLLMHLNFPLEIDSINASRYRGETQGSHIQWLLKPAVPLNGRTVLIVDDVLDEGVTLAEIVAYCRAEGAQAVYTAVLVDKDLGTEKPCRADFVGLTASNRYLFGYGMDYKHYLRNAAGIFACGPAPSQESTEPNE
ncbi:MAG: putative hypoxanthine phosphoribosyltransferase [Proteobacteria bacterium]|nr:putative hypoxanthine phosphoribosyltransferase [Pseudomonadota bacterium]